MTGRAGGTGPGSRDALSPGARSSTPPDAAPPAEQPAAQATGGGPIRRTIRIINPAGLHMRLADRFSRTARQYTCTVAVWNGETRADGKNLIDLIMLVVMPNSEVILEVDGPGAHEALDPLTAVLASPSGEDYTI